MAECCYCTNAIHFYQRRITFDTLEGQSMAHKDCYLEKTDRNKADLLQPFNMTGSSGITHIAGRALQRLLEYGVTDNMFWMGLKSKPWIIYDVAYSATEVHKIGMAVCKGMKLSSTQDVGFGPLSPQSATSLQAVARIYKKKTGLDKGKIYQIQGRGDGGERQKSVTEGFDGWCMRVKGRLYQNADEKVAWALEYEPSLREM